MHTPSCDPISSLRRQRSGGRLSRVATSALFAAALSFAGWTAVTADSRAVIADALPASEIADVARGGGESDDEAASVDANAHATDDDVSTTASRRAPGGRSCSTLVLQHGES